MAKVVAELLDQNKDGKIQDNLMTMMTTKKYHWLFLIFKVANIILFLGVADDSKVVAKLKCSIWFQLHTKQMDVSLSERSSFEVKYFVRYLCHIPIITLGYLDKYLSYHIFSECSSVKDLENIWLAIL